MLQFPRPRRPAQTQLLMPDGVRLPADVHVPVRSTGRAPLLLLHGTLVSRLDYRLFAPLLAAAWGGDVVVPDRRGRHDGLPQPPDHSLLTEADDLDAMVAAVGAVAVLGHSYGGTVTLLAAGRSPGAWAWVTYDAALNPDGALAAMWRPEFREEIDAGHLDAGWAMLVAGLRTAGPVSRLPLSVLRSTGRRLSTALPSGQRMFAALPGSLREMESVLAATEPFPLPERGLMLGGGLSPSYFRQTLDFVTTARPGVRTRVLPGLMHNGVMLPLPALARMIARWCATEHLRRPRPRS